jgi:hypothetical protein
MTVGAGFSLREKCHSRENGNPEKMELDSASSAE